MKSTFGIFSKAIYKKIYSNKLLDLNELIFLVPSLLFSDLSSPFLELCNKTVPIQAWHFW